MQGYVAACLRALSQVPGVKLHVLHLDFEDLPYQEELLKGVSNQRFLAREPNPQIPQQVVDARPDVVFVCGWFYPPYRQLLDRDELRSTHFMLGMDTPWSGSWRQRLNQIRLRGFMRRMEKVIVAGTHSAEFARRLDPTPGKIITGFYGFDFETFRAAGSRRDEAGEWPRRFFFAGRYAMVKGVDVLMEGYRRYRGRVADPWPLDCCGTGPEHALLSGHAGVSDLGYIQPSALPDLFADHGVFVMPSRVEPWGVAIAEAAATGLPLICTEVCGAAVDLLRPYYNGVTIPPADPGALAEAMAWMHENHHRLGVVGARSRNLAQPFSAEAWAERVHACMVAVMKPSPTR